MHFNRSARAWMITCGEWIQNHSKKMFDEYIFTEHARNEYERTIWFNPNVRKYLSHTHSYSISVQIERGESTLYCRPACNQKNTISYLYTSTVRIINTMNVQLWTMIRRILSPKIFVQSAIGTVLFAHSLFSYLSIEITFHFFFSHFHVNRNRYTKHHRDIDMNRFTQMIKP